MAWEELAPGADIKSDEDIAGWIKKTALLHTTCRALVQWVLQMKTLIMNAEKGYRGFTGR